MNDQEQVDQTYRQIDELCDKLWEAKKDRELLDKLQKYWDTRHVNTRWRKRPTKTLVLPAVDDIRDAIDEAMKG